MTNVHECLYPESSLYEAIIYMKKSKLNTVPVIDEDRKLEGVFTRSILYQMILQKTSLETSIKSFIKKDALAIPFDTPYDLVEKLVKESKVGTGVVIDKEYRVIGLFTKTDMISALFKSTRVLKEQQEIILNTSDLGAFLTNNNNEILFVNDKLLIMLDSTREELDGKDINKIINFKRDHLDNIISPQKIQIGNYQTVFRLSTYNTVKGNSGYIGLFQNISDLEQMAEELETVKKLKGLLETAIENAYDGIVTIDESGNITFVSPPMIELFSLDKKKVLGKNIQNVLPQLDLQKIMKTGIADVSEMLEIKGIRYIVQRIPVVQDGRIIAVIGKVMFRQLNEVRALFKKLDIMESKVKYYKQELRKSESSRFTMDHIISKDPQIEKLKRLSFKAAKGRSTILIRGESGTGKELFAHAIHNVSARKDGPFVTVNCAAIPDHLLESEFFGYEEGAFTGAKQKGKIGKFDLANGGTLFLDEIGDMSIQLQAKLLRVLQEKEFYRVGGTERIRVDVKIISATNRSLEEMVEKGSFREDLFYRLNVIAIEIPPLRSRKNDLHLLINLFIKEMNKLIGTSITGIEPQAQKALHNYKWPGNIRELKNAIERSVTFAEHGKIKLEDLPDYIINELEDITPDITSNIALNQNLLKKTEKELIDQALLMADGNKTKAAKILGISRSVLYTKLKKYEK